MTSFEMPPVTISLTCSVMNFILHWKETERVNSITNLKTTGAVRHWSSAWRGQRKWRASQSVHRMWETETKTGRMTREDALTERTVSTSWMTEWTKSKEDSLKTNIVLSKARGSEKDLKEGNESTVCRDKCIWVTLVLPSEWRRAHSWSWVIHICCSRASQAKRRHVNYKWPHPFMLLLQLI